ncbi:hypothetical protein M885DRAFT_625602, partial [Pelagophyceae sp. CCMP2097]
MDIDAPSGANNGAAPADSRAAAATPPPFGLMLTSKERRRRFRVAVGLTKGKVGMGPVGGAQAIAPTIEALQAIAPTIENMLTNLRAMRVRYGADQDVDLPAQARLLEFDAFTQRGLSAPFGGAFDSADIFYLPGADGAAGSLRVLRHDQANPAARKALRADLLEEGYVPLDEVSVMTLPGLAAECAAKRKAAAERAAAAVAAETAADDAAAEAHSAAAIRAAVSGGPASTTVCRFKNWYAITVHVVREARGGRLDNTAV